MTTGGMLFVAVQTRLGKAFVGKLSVEREIRQAELGIEWLRPAGPSTTWLVRRPMQRCWFGGGTNRAFVVAAWAWLRRRPDVRERVTFPTPFRASFVAENGLTTFPPVRFVVGV